MHWLLLLLSLSGCVPTIYCVGSSLTWGTPTTGQAGSHVTDKEPGGGYPDKLAAVLNAHVLNRGLSGFTTAYWLGRSPTDPNFALEKFYWPADPNGPWGNLPAHPPSPLKASFEQSVIYAGGTPATSTPRICVLMVGINDHFIHGSTAAAAFARYQTLIAHAGALCAHVLVNTELCGDPGDGSCPLNVRDPPGYVQAYNALIHQHAGEGYEVIEMDQEYVARGGQVGTDGLHPNCAGYRIMASVVADALTSRGYVDTLPGGSLPACP